MKYNSKARKSILFTLLVAVPLLFASCSKKADKSKTVTESHAKDEIEKAKELIELMKQSF